MSLYIPSDHTQKLGKGAGIAVDKHEDAFRNFGPPPPNYHVERKYTSIYVPGEGSKGTQEIFFTETSSANSRSSRNHPMSPAIPNPIIAAEPTLLRKVSQGIFEAPITYKADKDMVWKNADWQGALAGAMARIGVRNKENTGSVTTADIRKTYIGIPASERTARQNHVPYHPTDRASMVFEDEPAVAMVARLWGYSVILVCPFVSSDGTGYNRIYDTHDRPPMYARWSTGLQSHLPVLIMGCLPCQTTPQDRTYRAMWFWLEPKDVNNVPVWYQDLYETPHTLAIAKSIGFPVRDFAAEVFLWCIVQLQRKIVVGNYVPDAHLACWLWQFGTHLVENCKSWEKPHPVTFNYDHKRLAEYNAKFPKATRLTFAYLTRLILNPHMKAGNISIARYAEQWDRAIHAKIQYRYNKTDANWDDFTSKMAVARSLPF